jgi:hypothetical protein
MNDEHDGLKHEKETSMQQHHSEVRRLLTQISAEYEAAKCGLHGLATGVSEHRFITTKMERMSDLQGELQTLIGENAIALIAQELDKLPEDVHSQHLYPERQTEANFSTHEIQRNLDTP